MKLLKFFEDFNEIRSIISNLEEICFELNDDGIRTECKHNVPNSKYAPLPGQREHISVGLEHTYITRDLPFIDYKEEVLFGKVQDVVFRILDYMKSCGWKPSYVIFDGESYHIEKNTEGPIQWLVRNFQPESVLSGLQIDFIKDKIS